MGAWIETVWSVAYRYSAPSHSIWVRGLKPSVTDAFGYGLVSHSIWVRGLKP